MSPHYSETRKTVLLSVAECMSLFNRSRATVQRRIKGRKGAGLYAEMVNEKRKGRGATRVLYVDPHTLGWPVPSDEAVKTFGASLQGIIPSSEHHGLLETSGEEKTANIEPSSKALAASAGMRPRTPEVMLPKTASLMELMRHDPALLFEQSRDTVHLDTDLTYARELHRDLLPALNSMPRSDARSAAIKVVAQKREVQIMLMNADERKEFLRTYVGRVISNHPNDMWQQDMTRCDVFVYDEDTQQIYRPRVQAVIDVFSGCIMGVGFSPDEDQIQADLPFFRALLPKEEQQAGQYPYFGVPKRIYIDNGKTYKSEHYERLARDLGIELVHSQTASSTKSTGVA